MAVRAPRNAADVPHVLALGSGYVTIHVYRALAGWIRRKRVRMTVIDRNNFHCFHGLVPEMLAGKLQPGTVLSASRRLLPGARFCNGEIMHVDLEGRQVVYSRSLDGKEFTVGYDHLVVDVGSTADLDHFPGSAEHSLHLKAFQDILHTKYHLITMLELADVETDPVELERLLGFVVVGGNYAGIEVASELADFLPRTARRQYPNVPADKIRITVVHAGAHVLPELGERFPGLQAYAERVLTANPHVQMRTGSRLGSATAEEAILSTGERLPARTIINCTGTVPSPLLARFRVERDDTGRVVTDACLRVRGLPQVWAGGDCAAVPHPRGGTCPPLAVWAMAAGRQIGRNIKATIGGRSPRPYHFTGLADACTLGHWRAVGHLKGVPLRGLTAYLGWRFFMVRFLPAREKKVRLLLDWLLGGAFGRDLINMGGHRPLAVRHVLYEPQQDIVREGDVGQSLLIIRSGEVEVIKRRADGSGSDRVATLAAGDTFGEIAVFRHVRRTATVRALSRVELLHVRGEAALALSEASRDLARALKADVRGVSRE